MANIFSATKEPSLFPFAFSYPSISEEEYHLFYKYERTLFTLLIVFLHRDITRVIPVIGFLIWLEREGYTSKNLAQILLNSLTPDVINQVVDEAMVCLRILENKSANFMFEGSSSRYDISMLQVFLDRKNLHLEDLHEKQDPIFNEVSFIANDVSSKAFHDIMEKFMLGDRLSLMQSLEQIIAHGSLGGLQHMHPMAGFYQASTTGDTFKDAQIMTKFSMAQQYQPMVDPLGTSNHLAMSTPVIDRNPLYATSHDVPITREPEEEAPPEDRTIFLTFSKGYPISETEVRHFFTRLFGDFIESIHMQPVEDDDQPLYARIVARSASIAKAITERDGVNGKTKYSINGKHAWARIFTQRKRSS